MRARVVTAQKRQFCKRPTTAKCVSLTVWGAEAWSKEQLHSCLLYTSDAADEL